MEEINKIDNIFKNKLEHYSEGIPSPNWSDFTEKRNNSLFDEIAKQKINAAQVAPPTPNFNQIKSRIPQSNNKYKLYAAIGISSLFIGLIAYFLTNNSVEQRNNEISSPIPTLPIKIEKDTDFNFRNRVKTIDEKVITDSPILHFQGDSAVKLSSIELALYENYTKKYVLSDFELNQKFDRLYKVLRDLIYQPNFAQTSNNVYALHQSKNGWGGNLNTPFLLNKRSRKIALQASMFVGGEFSDLAYSEQVQGLSENESLVSHALNSGVSIGIDTRKWGIETGLLYSNNSFASVYEDINFDELQSVDVMEMSMLKVPLNFKWKFDNSDKWDFYTVTGGVFSFGLSTTGYEPIVSRTLNSSEEPSLGIISDDIPSSFVETSLLDAKPRNYNYLSANLGVGIQRIINKKWSIYVQPTYQRTILTSSVNPLFNSSQTISISGGVKVNLNGTTKK